ncbi:hypothetical protein ACB094_03G092600 [Castanea mollissima]
MEALQPAAKMLVELSKSQDSAPVTASPPSSSSLALSSPMGFTLQSFLMLSRQSMSSPPWPSPSSSAIASLSSSPLPLLSTARLLVYSSLLAPLAVDPAKPDIVDLRDIKIVKTLGGTVDDTELVKCLFFRCTHSYGERDNRRHISPTKTDIEIVVSDYAQMYRILKEEIHLN